MSNTKFYKWVNEAVLIIDIELSDRQWEINLAYQGVTINWSQLNK